MYKSLSVLESFVFSLMFHPVEQTHLCPNQGELQNRSNQNSRSFAVKISQDGSKSVKMGQNQSKSVKIGQIKTQGHTRSKSVDAHT
jgi:hypothetical protein